LFTVPKTMLSSANFKIPVVIETSSSKSLI